MSATAVATSPPCVPSASCSWFSSGPDAPRPSGSCRMLGKGLPTLNSPVSRMACPQAEALGLSCEWKLAPDSCLHHADKAMTTQKGTRGVG